MLFLKFVTDGIVAQDRHCQSGRMRGIGLIEVLVALLVLSLSVLGYVGLQKKGLDATQEAFWRNRSSAIAVNLIDRIRANPAALAVYTDSTAWDRISSQNHLGCYGAVTCTSAAVAEADIADLKRMVEQSLPKGAITVDRCIASGASNCVFVAWAGTPVKSCVFADEHCLRMGFINTVE